MRVDFLFLGHTAESYLAQGIADFEQRLARYCQPRIRVVKERRGKMSEAARIEVEGRDLLAQVEEKSFLVALDPGGQALDSQQWAGMFRQWEGQGRRTVSFVIGGAWGLSNEVRAAAGLLLSLSPLTFTHEMARLILLEQVYRAFNILAGSQYHK